jgi:hypothetical protein
MPPAASGFTDHCGPSACVVGCCRPDDELNHLKEYPMKKINLFTLVVFAALCLPVLGCAATSTNEGTKAYVDDSVLTTKVKAAILNEPSLKSLEIGVETYKGNVQLSGFVASNAEISKAGMVARAVDGVSSVKNDLRLKK